ncbi:hypothetical protein ACOMHN_010234 [Nucella lapillus]
MSYSAKITILHQPVFPRAVDPTLSGLGCVFGIQTCGIPLDLRYVNGGVKVFERSVFDALYQWRGQGLRGQSLMHCVSGGVKVCERSVFDALCQWRGQGLRGSAAANHFDNSSQTTRTTTTAKLPPSNSQAAPRPCNTNCRSFRARGRPDCQWIDSVRYSCDVT